MNLSGNRFEYGGHPSSRYGDLIIAEVETEAIRAMAADVSYATIRDADGRRRHMGGLSVADEPLAFDLEFIREEPLSRREARDIARWLFHQSDYQKLYVARDADDSMERIDGKIKRTYLECVFSNPQRIEYADGLHGWRCTCECATPMAVQEEISKTFTNFTEKITVYVDSDGQDYVYPRIEITVGNDMTGTSTSDYYLGDVTRDGEITAADALVALQIADGKVTADNEQIALADINNNGSITESDCDSILKYSTGGGFYNSIGFIKPQWKSSNFLGDINRDGKINSIDFTLSQRISSGTYKADDEQIALADIDGDGIVTKMDTKQISMNKLFLFAFKRYPMVTSRYSLGDVNRDGIIDDKDVALLEDIVAGDCTPDREQVALADINQDGKLTQNDIELLKTFTENNFGSLGRIKPNYQSLTQTVLVNNTSADSSMTITGVAANDRLKIDCREGRIIRGDDDSMMNYYSQVADQGFLRLAPGENVLDICTLVDNYTSKEKRYDRLQSVTISWNNERWIL